MRDSVQFVKGVGPTRLEKFEKLGIRTIGDLIWYFPRDYEFLTERKHIHELRANEELQTIVGEIIEMSSRTSPKGMDMVSIVVSDGQNVLETIWFNQPFITNRLRYGMKVVVAGKPKKRYGQWQMPNPRIRPITEEEATLSTDAILPKYPLTEGLHPEALRKSTREVVTKYAHLLEEPLPDYLIKKHALLGIQEAMKCTHMPSHPTHPDAARKRWAYEELIVLQTALALQRRDQEKQHQATPLPVSKIMDERIRKLFPFPLTPGQDKAVAALIKDLSQPKPMRRLLQADVGAGKTAVAVYALLVAVANKHQAAIMAPTEVLARQHWRTLSRYLAHGRVRMQLLTGNLTESERRLALKEIKSGQLDLVIGTQALIQNDVEFNKLGVVVIDEQHRFGVLQRDQFRRMGLDPHYLVMTATPIPRSVALTVFGDLDISVIKQLPPGRKPVVTKWTPEENRDLLYDNLVTKLAEGKQLYVICPQIADNPEAELTGAKTMYEKLRTGPFKSSEVALLHGRMAEEEKEVTMNRFRENQVQVLVATTVVEVGVDVPNATLMIIEQADRFGLSQLHQLRGRISRGSSAGECFLFAEAGTDVTRDRLRFFVRTTDGFALAEHDLELRGMGEFFGTRQHGMGELRFAHPVRDIELVEMARADALELVARDPQLSEVDHAGLRMAITTRFGDRISLAKVG